MTILEDYKKKVIEIVNLAYNNSIDPKKLDQYINKMIYKVSDKKVTAVGRNLYEYEYHQEFDANNIPNIISENQLNILANGAFTKNFDPPSSIIMETWMTNRDVFKGSSLKYLEEGNIPKHVEFKNKEIKVKQDTNSMFGASTMSKSYVSNVDVGGAITSQARNFISEMMWAIEKFLDSNMTFGDLNETLCFITETLKDKSNISGELLKYVTYIPTPDDCRTRFIKITKDISRIRKTTTNMQKTLFLMFENMSDKDRIFFYYSCNPYEFIGRNVEVSKMMKYVITNGVEFVNPYKMPVELEEDFKMILKLMRAFTFSSVPTYDRVIKYQTRKRKVCILSDTDSIMPTMIKSIDETLKVLNLQYINDDSVAIIKLIMFYVFIITELLDDACMAFAIDCNSQIEGRKFRLKMKNEIFFTTVLMYSVKKNYIGIKEYVEGKKVPADQQLAITGRALGAANLNKYVSEQINSILENLVLRNDMSDPVEIIRKINEISKHIEDSILSGDISFGIFARWNNVNQIKNPESTAAARAGLIWNHLYPDDLLVPGDGIYMFDTNLKSEEDLERIDPKYSEIKEKIRNYVFRVKHAGDYDFARFGLKKFAVPADSDTESIPEWIIPFITVTSMISKHLQPIASLSKSILLSQCKYSVESGSGSSSTKKMTASNLIQF